MNILIVSESLQSRREISRQLAKIGYQDCFFAEDGRRALQLLRADPFECLVLDGSLTQMPVSQFLTLAVGFEFSHAIVIVSSGNEDIGVPVSIKSRVQFVFRPLTALRLQATMSLFHEKESKVASK